MSKENSEITNSDILEKFFSIIKADMNIPIDAKMDLLTSLAGLKLDIYQSAIEISEERNHPSVTQRDLIDAVRRMIPWWEPSPSKEEIDRAIKDGKEFLRSKQNNGGWGVYHDWIGGLAKTCEQGQKWKECPPNTIWDTTAALIALSKGEKGIDSENITRSIEWLKKQERNSDGGYPYLPKEYWEFMHTGVSRPVESSVYETSAAVIAFIEVGEKPDSDEINRCLEFLLITQDKVFGAWGGEPSDDMDVRATSWAILAQIKAGLDPKSEGIQRAIQWLRENQRDDGGWGLRWKGGSGQSLVTSTSDAITALLAAGSDPANEAVQRGINFITSIQKLEENKKGELGLVWSCNDEIDVSSIENTAVAINILLNIGKNIKSLNIVNAIQWLLGNEQKGESWGWDTPQVIQCINNYLIYIY
jgi:sporulenol synthase